MKEQTIKEQLVNADARITGVTQPVNRTEQKQIIEDLKNNKNKK